MRIATAALLLMIASTLVACVHETTVFHSFNGADYFRGDPVAPADKSVSQRQNLYHLADSSHRPRQLSPNSRRHARKSP